MCYSAYFKEVGALWNDTNGDTEFQQVFGEKISKYQVYNPLVQDNITFFVRNKQIIFRNYKLYVVFRNY